MNTTLGGCKGEEMVSEGERGVEKLAGGDYQQKREVAARYPFLLSLPITPLG